MTSAIKMVVVKIGIRTVVAVGVVLAWMWVTREPADVSAPVADPNVTARLYDVEKIRDRALRFGRELERLDIEPRPYAQGYAGVRELDRMDTPVDEAQFKRLIENKVTDRVNLDEWVVNGGSVGTANYAGGKLLIVNAPGVQRGVREYLDLLEGAR